MAGPDSMVSLLRPVLADDPRFRGYLPRNRWTLCVGAGISRGLSPTWSELAHVLVNEAFRLTLDTATFEEMVGKSGWTLDAWIQAAASEFDQRGRTPAEFVDLIETVLYSTVRLKAKGCKFERYLSTVLNFPKNAPKDYVVEICDFLDASFSDSSLIQVAQFLIRAAKCDRAPLAVITFNADTFLETYIDLFLRREHYLGPGPHSHPKYYFSSVSRSGEDSSRKIPIFHCHGSVTPLYRTGKKPYDARDRLIFLEQEYLATLSNRASWAQTVFLFHAQSTKLAFCGWSMSDTNIRRWMSAIELERGIDKKLLRKGTIVNPEHIWIRPKPASTAEEAIYLASLLHLGVRPAWIPAWDTLERSLANLGAVP